MSQANQAATYGRSHTEQEVLRVLWSSYGQKLVRSEIHRRLPQAHRPTPGRVGQILAALLNEGLVDRAEQRAQGSKTAGFYDLTLQGRELCRSLGFEHDERLLFPVTEENLRTFLTRKHLARRPEEASGRIIAVWGYRGGLGRTTLVAHVARGLAQKLADSEQLLVIDLDLASPGLDDFFAPQGLGPCRGLGGLLVDFARHPPRKRTLWLLGALSSPEYVLRPLDDVPKLAYLPSGLNPGQNELTASERAEALAMLRAEASGRSCSDLRPSEFLSELRDALVAKFAKIILDPEVGRSLGAWIATQALADQFVLCAKMSDTSAATLAGIRAVLASFLNGQKSLQSGGVCTFLIRLSEPTTVTDLDLWIEQHLLIEASGTAAGAYQVEQLPYDVRLAEHPHRWENTHFFAALIGQLERPGSTHDVKVIPPELQALLAVLDPTTPSDRRSIATGILENAPLQEFVRWANWFIQEKTLHTTTDTQGEKIIENVINVHAKRLLSKILQK